MNHSTRLSLRLHLSLSFCRHALHIKSFNFPQKEGVSICLQNYWTRFTEPPSICPYQGSGIAKLIPHASEEAIDLMNQLLAHNPEKRCAFVRLRSRVYSRAETPRFKCAACVLLWGFGRCFAAAIFARNRRLLVDHRITAEQALRHPYFRELRELEYRCALLGTLNISG